MWNCCTVVVLADSVRVSRSPLLPRYSTNADQRNVRRRAAFFYSYRHSALKARSKVGQQSRRKATALRTGPAAPSQRIQQTRALEVLFKLRRVVRAATARAVPEARAIVTGAQLWALCEIQEHSGIKVTDLASSMALQQSTVSNLIDKLLAKRLVRRQRDSRDARVVNLSVTSAGDRVVRLAQSKRSALLEALERVPLQALRRLGDELENLLRCMQMPRPGNK